MKVGEKECSKDVKKRIEDDECEFVMMGRIAELRMETLEEIRKAK